MHDQEPTTIAARLGVMPFSREPIKVAGVATRATLRTWCAYTSGRPSAEVASWHIDQLRSLYHCGVNSYLTLDETQRARGIDKATAVYKPKHPADPLPGGLPLDPPARPKVTDAIDQNDTDTGEEDTMEDVDQIARKIAEVLGAGRRNQPAGISEARVLELIKLHATTPIPLDVKVGDAPRIKIDTPHKALPAALAWLASGAHVALVGPAGCGKTELAAQAAKSLGLPFRSAGALDSKYALLGFIDANGRTVRTPFRETFEKGGLFLLDEVDASSPSVPLALNAALANGHCDFADANVEMHPDFKVMVAANTFGRGADRQYVGRNQLDAATLDRFAWLPVDYDEKLERALCGDDAWCDRVQALRNGARKTGARVVISMRASIRGARALAAGVSRSDAEEALIWKGIDATERNKIEAAAK